MASERPARSSVSAALLHFHVAKSRRFPRVTILFRKIPCNTGATSVRTPFMAIRARRRASDGAAAGVWSRIMPICLVHPFAAIY
jgi:hypothetical protein